MHGPTIIHDFSKIDFEKPGKHHYNVAFHHDSSWGNSLVPLTVINGLRGAGKTLAVFGGTHGNEYEGPVVLNLAPAKIAGEIPGDRVSDPEKQSDWPAIAYAADGSLYAVYVNTQGAGPG